MTRVDLLLADHAQVADGKLFLAGGGIDGAVFPHEAPQGLPYPVTFAVAGAVEFDGDADGAHPIAFEVVDADGRPPLATPDGGRAALTGGFDVTVFNSERAASVVVPFAFNIHNAPFAALGRYRVRVLVDGEGSAAKSFTVRMASPGPAVSPD